jgi:hypothetical protein
MKFNFIGSKDQIERLSQLKLKEGNGFPQFYILLVTY